MYIKDTVLYRYCKDEEVIKRMTKVFAGLYTLDLVWLPTHMYSNTDSCGLNHVRLIII